VRLLLWYIVAVFLIGPLIAAPFSGGASLGFYVVPFLVFDFRDWDKFTIGCYSVLGFLAVALLFWAIHQFVRMTIRYQMRRLHTAQLYRRTH
jgi:hypothetical protein